MFKRAIQYNFNAGMVVNRGADKGRRGLSWSVNIKHNEKYVNAAFVDSKQLHSDDMEEHHKKYK